MSRVPESVLSLPLEEPADLAFKEAVEGVIDEHARLARWRDYPLKS
jgi:hypothetical protein